MKPNSTITLYRSLRFTLAGALMLGLAACDQQPGADNPGKSLDNLVQNAGRDRASAPAPSMGAPSALPPGTPTSDAMLEDKVKAAISADSGLRTITVDVTSSDGVVTLQGTAETPAMSHRAAMVALNVDGVRSVRNEMVIVKKS
jgi:hyperosmotically inducible protein